MFKKVNHQDAKGYICSECPEEVIEDRFMLQHGKWHTRRGDKGVMVPVGFPERQFQDLVAQEKAKP